jgi:hypothetical protein
MTVTPETIADLGAFLDRHSDCPEDVARAALRDAAAGRLNSLPAATDFAGEVLRARIVAAIGGALAATPAETGPGQIARTGATFDRVLAFRKAAGDERLLSFADAVASSELPDAAALVLIGKARDDLLARAAPPARQTIEQRAAALPEAGGEAVALPTGRAEQARASWSKAFDAAAKAGSVVVRG